jgi:hypothetical protein
MPAPFGFMLGIEAEVQKRVVVRTGDHDDVAASTAIAPARSTARDEFLSPERKTAVAAVTGFDQNRDFVYEHGV